MSIPTTAEVLAKISGYPRNLTWANFRKVNQSPQPPFQAMTSSSYATSGYSTRLVGTEYRPVFSGRFLATVTISTLGTWVLNQQAAQTDDLLRHEQGHFDITGLVARDLCRDLMSIEISQDIIAIDRTLPNNPSANQLLRAAHEYIRHEVDRCSQQARASLARLQSRRENGLLVDGLYDQETQHGQVLLAQQKWNDIFRYSRDNDTSLSVTMMVFST
jgi:hypothetical protein